MPQFSAIRRAALALTMTLAAMPVPRWAEGTVLTGTASWYGPGFDGRTTANGETFDQDALTAAHRTLPFGTRVRVTYRDTGVSVVVRINDRGPYHGNRAIDLSHEAAREIGLVPAGTGRVTMEVLGRARG